MASMQTISVCIIAFLRLTVADENPYVPKTIYSPPATSYGVPILSVEALKPVHASQITTNFLYNIPNKLKAFEVLGIPEAPKPISYVYGAPIVPRPIPLEVVYDLPAEPTTTPKPTIHHVYGVPAISIPKPHYDTPAIQIAKPKPISQVYGVPTGGVPKPNPIIYKVPVETPKPVDAPKITTSFSYTIPNEVKPSEVYDVPQAPKPISYIYGAPIVPVPKPTPVKVVYDIPASTETPKPTISYVYGAPPTPAPKPKPTVHHVYGVPTIPAPKIQHEAPVTEAPKPKPISHVYGVPVGEVSKPKPIHYVYGIPTTAAPKPPAPSVVFNSPGIHTQYGIPAEIIGIPRLYTPYS